MRVEGTANELCQGFNQVDATYRNDLRELNELNFQRFDAKLEQRVTASEVRLRSEMQGGFANLRAHIEERLGAQQTFLQERLDSQQGRLDERLGAMETRLGAVQTHLEARLDAQMKWMFRYFVTTLLALGGLMIGLNQLGG